MGDIIGLFLVKLSFRICSGSAVEMGKTISKPYHSLNRVKGLLFLGEKRKNNAELMNTITFNNHGEITVLIFNKQ